MIIVELGAGPTVSREPETQCVAGGLLLRPGTHALAVGTTDTHPLLRGEEGAIFFRIKSIFNFIFRYANFLYSILEAGKWKGKPPLMR